MSFDDGPPIIPAVTCRLTSALLKAKLGFQQYLILVIRWSLVNRGLFCSSNKSLADVPTVELPYEALD